ncbi:hypothetical protein LSAT2_002535 [Lamellibrachia satsuma]|nr:hypothetical protein LSAT2_002535 [Lamellibrachia satsuma]
MFGLQSMSALQPSLSRIPEALRYTKHTRLNHGYVGRLAKDGATQTDTEAPPPALTQTNHHINHILADEETNSSHVNVACETTHTLASYKMTSHGSAAAK